MAVITFTTLFVKNNSLHFYEGEHSTYSASEFDCLSYKEKLKVWQTAKPYEQKATFGDAITLMVHTQANNPGGGYASNAFLQLFDINDELIAAIPYSAAQQNAQNVYYPNGSTTPIPLDSYAWQFSFGDLLSPATDSGIYYLKLINVGSDTVSTLEYYSEPILIYDDVPNTIVISGQNFTNRESQKILINGWTGDFNPVFSTRVEGYVNLYKPKSVYINYLQQQYLSQQLSSQNLRSFTLQIGGSPTMGVPDYMLEKVTELLIMDSMTVTTVAPNGIPITTPYILDIDSDSAPKFIGSKQDPEASQLCWDKFTIREKYPVQNAFYRKVDNPVIPLDLFTGARSGGVFTPYAVVPWSIIINGITHNISHVQANIISTDEDAYLTFLQSQFAAFGAGGTITRNISTGVFTYTPIIGETCSIPNAVVVMVDHFIADINTSSIGCTQAYTTQDASGTFGRQIVAWDGVSAGAIMTTALLTSPYTIHKTFLSGASTTKSWFFHENRTTLSDFDGSASSALLRSVTGKWSSTLRQLYILNNPSLTDPYSGLSLTSCASALVLFNFRANNTTSISGSIFTTPMPNLKQVILQQNKLSTAQIDQHINDFVNNSWTGATGGILTCWGNIGAASAASLTSRNALITAGWTVTI